VHRKGVEKSGTILHLNLDEFLFVNKFARNFLPKIELDFLWKCPSKSFDTFSEEGFSVELWKIRLTEESLIGK